MLERRALLLVRDAHVSGASAYPWKRWGMFVSVEEVAGNSTLRCEPNAIADGTQQRWVAERHTRLK